MESKRTILIADDDPNIRKVVRFALEKADFEVVEAYDGEQAVEFHTLPGVELIVLDVLMPKMDGTDVCREIRKTSNVPIVFLSSNDDEIDKVLGLEMGGDDYISKPFSPRELVARVRAILRRGSRPEESVQTAHGKLRVDLESFSVFWGDDPIQVTKSEFEILAKLISAPGKVFRRNELMRGSVVSDRTIDSHVGHLRKKFEALGVAPVETVHGVGYKLGDCS